MVAIGPLTNIAIATRLCPELPTLLKSVYIIGGSTYQGNITQWAEWNFHCDPLAAHITLQHFCPKIKVHLVPWETCLENRLDFDTFFESFAGVDTPAARLLESICMTEYYEEERKKGLGYILADQFIPLTVVYPESVLKKVVYTTLRVNTTPSDPKYGQAEYVSSDVSSDISSDVSSDVSSDDSGLVVYTKFNMKLMAQMFYNAVRRIK